MHFKSNKWKAKFMNYIVCSLRINSNSNYFQKVLMLLVSDLKL